MATTAIFSGNSRFANDFQQIIERSVAIASLPIRQLTVEKAALSDQSAAVGRIDAKFLDLQKAIESLSLTTGQSALKASVSDSAIVSAGVSAGAIEGGYSIEVVGLGSYSNAISMDGLPVVADPYTVNISASSSFTLTVDGVSHSIAPEKNTLASLAEAINNSEAGVRATMINLGSVAAPDYRLSIQGESLAASTIQLNDGAADLLFTQATGSAATYRVNGQPATPISSLSRTVTVAPGLTIDLLKAGSAEVTVSRNTGSISSALNSFVTAFNAAVAELDGHRGESKGALFGQGVVGSLSQSLRELTSYTSLTGGVGSLTALGLSFDREGRLSFDSGMLDSLAAGNMSAVLDFIGDSTAGFAKFAADLIDGLEGTPNGLIKSIAKSLSSQIQTQDRLIAQNEDRVKLMREGLERQMSAADTLIAGLEQQVKYFNGLFDAMKTNYENNR